MDRLDAMSVFVAVIDEGSMVGAARKLGRSPASITRAVSMLEERLGERLLHRTTRALRPTERGERHAAVYRNVLAELSEVEGADCQQARIEGQIALTAPELFGRMKVMPVVETFLAAHPSVRVRVLLLNRVVNLIEEGVDMAIRLAPLPDSGLVAVRLGVMRHLVCAAPSYIDSHGALGRPADVCQRLCIGQEGYDRELWHFGDPASGRRRRLSVAIQPRIAVNSAGAAIEAALRGHGLCRVLAYQVMNHIKAGRLVPLLTGFEPEPVPIHLVFHPIPRRNAALRLFVDHAECQLRTMVTAVTEAAARFATP